MSIIDKRFRLADDVGAAGLHCSAAGVFLAGTPLLRETAIGLEPRSEAEVEALLKAAYGADVGSSQIRARLGVAAQALNKGDLPRAMVASVQMRLPNLDRAGRERLCHTNQALEGLAKYDPNEPRDWHGRWTDGGASSAPAPMAKPTDAAVKPVSSAHRPRAHSKPAASVGVSANRPVQPLHPTPPSPSAGNASLQAQAKAALATLQPRLEQKYDLLNAIGFADKTIGFAQWLESNGAKLSPQDRAGALAEYVFLQDRLSFWLGYQLKSPRSHNALLGAAQLLFQAAQNTHLVGPNLPKSMQGVVVAAMAYDAPPVEPSIRRPRAEPIDLPPTPVHWAEPVDGIGDTVSNREVGIDWNKGIREQGGP